MNPAISRRDVFLSVAAIAATASALPSQVLPTTGAPTRGVSSAVIAFVSEGQSIALAEANAQALSSGTVRMLCSRLRLLARHLEGISQANPKIVEGRDGASVLSGQILRQAVHLFELSAFLNGRRSFRVVRRAVAESSALCDAARTKGIRQDMFQLLSGSHALLVTATANL